MLASATDVSGKRDFHAKRRKEQLVKWKETGLMTLLFLIFVLIALNNLKSFTGANAIFYPAILFLKIIGIAATLLLLIFEIAKANPQLQKFCAGGGKVNCNAILSSKAAKLFPWLSWSEIGFYYFAGSFMYLLIAPAEAMQVLPILNIISLPFILFSIYYQKYVAKQWCSLCLAVQSILALEFLVFVANGISFQFPALNAIEFAMIAFLIPIIGWSLVKPVLIKNVEGKRTKRELARLKYNPVLFESLLSKQKQIQINPEGLGITLGNPNATHTIIKVCNPYCGPCAKAHPEIEKIIEENEEVGVQVIFTATNDKNDSRAQPVKHLLAIAESDDGELIKKALDDWYLAPEKDYKLFSTKYPMNGELENQANKLEAMDKWCKETGIEFTPTFFVDGYQLPEV